MSEQFEHNIRKKLQDAEVPFEPMAWERMEKILDGPPNRRPIFWWLSGLVLFLGICGWWYFTTQNVDNSTPLAKNEFTGNPSAATQNDTISKNAAAANISASSQSDKITHKPSDVTKPPSGNSASSALKHENSSLSRIGHVDKVGSKTADEKKAYQLYPAKRNNNLLQSVDVNKSANNSGKETNKEKAKELETNVVDNPQLMTSSSAGNINTTIVDRKDVDKPTTSIAISTDKDKKSIHPVTDLNKTGTNQLPATGNVDNTDTNLVAKNKTDLWKAPRRKGFEGGIHLGPDINATGSFTGLRAGFTGGLLLRYHVNNRIYFSTGAAYTKKLYKASPKEYNTPYPGNYTKIDADCDVIDVPLNIHYVFADRETGRWNVSAGLSTYLMLREKYEYSYPNYYKRTRVFSNLNQHYFSVLNISAGWEKNTKGRLNWGLQPYVKVPLGGVGEGQVKLYSAGLSLQVTMGKK